MSTSKLGESIWNASRADEGTISYIGATHVAAVVLDLLTSDDMRWVIGEVLRDHSFDLDYGECMCGLRTSTGEVVVHVAGVALDAIRRELGGADT